MRQTLVFLLVLLTSVASFQVAADAVPRPEPADIQARIDGLGERRLPEADQRSAQQALEQALAHLSAAQSSRQQAEALKKQVAEAPAQTTLAQQRLAALNATPPSPLAINDDTRLERLDTLLAEHKSKLTQWQQALDEANTLVVSARTGPERAHAEITANQTRMQAIDAALKSGREPGRETRGLNAERRDNLAAEWHALEARTALRLQELAASSVLLDLGQARRELASVEVGRLQDNIRLLQDAINERRRSQSLETIETLARESEQAGEAAGRGDPGSALLTRELGANQKLSEYLLRATEHHNELTQRNLQVRQQLDSLTRSSTVIEEQINVLQGSQLLSRILYEQKRTLPSPQVDTRLTEQIADIRLYQFEINKQREQLGNPQAQATRLLADYPPGQRTDELHQSLVSVLNTRAELLERLNRELNALLSESVTLQLSERELQVVSDRLRTTLEEQIFWVPSNRPLDLAWFKALPGALERQLATMPWTTGTQELWSGLQARPFLFLPVLLLTAALLWRRSWLREKLKKLHADIGYVRRDSQLHTPMAIFVNVLLALPISLLLALGGLALQMDARGQNVSLGAAMLQMAQAWLVFYTAYRILAPDGVAERHFHWPAEQARFMFLHLRRLGLVVLAVVGVVAIAEHQPEILADDVLGVLILLTGFAIMAWLMSRLLSHRPKEAPPSPVHAIISVALALMPLALIAALFMGYYYTALKLTGRLIDTLFVLILWRLLEATLVRGLSVAARRLDYQRAVARREAAEQEGRGETGDAERNEGLENPALNLERINQQSLRLLRLGLLGVLGVGLYWVWADLITVFAYLENITLYEYTSGSGDTASLVPISLRDLIGAAVIATIAFMLATNLPGLLEVLVLSRMRLAQGSAYATTTLLSYVIMATGVVATLSTLGVSWDKLQWLVAALSVGLGFGLQEIFANFVSGLIILFERPLRIGDTVTIGNLSGTVTRIQIRATTITDFDRKEMIVPNKAFITGELTNWSLTDTVTRITVRVGVAYGSDLELTRKLLLQIANENPRVLKEPAPQVFFLTFGASTLDHELRVHVRELADRNAAIDEINRRIDALFKEHGIEIAFNQMDVHIRSIDGKEAKLHTVPSAPPATGSGEAQ
jgi:potassium-dependent mechanosensitive channel